MAKTETKTVKLYHPAGFEVEVVGEARADVLKARGYTTTKSTSTVREATAASFKENHEGARYGMVDAYPQPANPEDRLKHREAAIKANRERAEADRERELERIERENLPGAERARLRDAERSKEDATYAEPTAVPMGETAKKATRGRRKTKAKS